MSRLQSKLPNREIYWTGDSAKAKILEALLALIDDNSAHIFDYGCGSAKRWQQVLRNHPKIQLIGYDPDKLAIQKARALFKGSQAEFYCGDELEDLSFSADFVLSLSVLEHVFDVRAYLLNAKRFLSQDGLFFLSYDDGHFRNFVDLSSPRSWYVEGRIWIHNLIAPAMAWLGHESIYQGRVSRRFVDRLIESIGFVVDDCFYSNLRSFKELSKHVSASRREDFVRFWVDVEEDLNSRFVQETSPQWGDSVNLWRVMGTRTLVLRHGPAR